MWSQELDSDPHGSLKTQNTPQFPSPTQLRGTMAILWQYVTSRNKAMSFAGISLHWKRAFKTENHCWIGYPWTYIYTYRYFSNPFMLHPSQHAPSISSTFSICHKRAPITGAWQLPPPNASELSEDETFCKKQTCFCNVIPKHVCVLDLNPRSHFTVSFRVPTLEYITWRMCKIGKFHSELQ